jgi:hypothetical protein
MDLILKTGPGGRKQIGQSIVNRPGEIAVLATFDVGPLQRLLLALFMEGLLSGGHTLYDEKRGKFLVGDVGQLADETPGAPVADAMTPVAWVITYETSHFSFEGHGLTEEQANEALGRALTAHGERLGLPSDWWEGDDFRTTAVIPGAGFRDGEMIA